MHHAARQGHHPDGVVHGIAGTSQLGENNRRDGNKDEEKRGGGLGRHAAGHDARRQRQRHDEAKRPRDAWLERELQPHDARDRD